MTARLRKKKQPTAAEKKSQRELPRHIAQPTATITHGMMARRNSAVLVGAAPRGGPYSPTRRINTANHPTINTQTWQALTTLYQNNPIEHSLFVLADGSFKITTGDALTTSSVLYTNAGEVEFAAHTHEGLADFSLEDAQILIARLLKNPQKEIEHTILGRGDSGEIEWQRVTLAIKNGELIVTSEADGIAAGRLSATKELMREVYAAGQGLEPAELELWARQQAQAPKTTLTLPTGLANGMWRDDFLKFIADLDLAKHVKNIGLTQAIKNGEAHTVTLCGELKQEIRCLTLNSNDVQKKAMAYFNLVFTITRVDDEFVVSVRDCSGTNSKAILAALVANSHIDWGNVRQNDHCLYTKALTAQLEAAVFQAELAGQRGGGGVGWNFPDNSRGQFIKFIADLDLAKYAKNTEAVKALKEGESQTMTLSGNLGSNKFSYLTLNPDDELMGEGYFNIIFTIMRIDGELVVTVKDCIGNNAETVIVALANNRFVNWEKIRQNDPNLYAKVLTSALESSLFHMGLDANVSRGGWTIPDDSRDRFLKFIASLDLVKHAGNIEAIKALKEGMSQTITLTGRLSSQVAALSLNPGDHQTDERGRFNLIFTVTRIADTLVVTVKECIGASDKAIMAALADNNHIDWKRTKQDNTNFYTKSLAAALEASVFQTELAAARSNQGWSFPDVSRDQFLSFITKLDLAKHAQNIQVVTALKDGESQVIRLSGLLSTKLHVLNLNPNDNQKGGISYFNITLTITRVGGKLIVMVKDCTGKNADAIAQALKNNPHVQVPSWFNMIYGKRPLTRNVRPLLARLSEYGRTRLLHKMRALGFGLEDDTVAATPQNIAHAAREVLLDLAREFDHAKKNEISWSNNDPRLGLALTFSSFTGDQKFSPDEATLVSALAMNALTRTREHALLEHRRALREAGDSPIAESAWDNVFSDELKSYMRDVTKEMFGLDIGDADLAHEMLKIPFNEVVGAAYFKLTLGAGTGGSRTAPTKTMGGAVAMSHEILLHAWHQKRRGDTLTWFIDGYQKASSWERDRVLRIVNFEIENVTELFNSWQLDTESPFRLIDGLTAAAARFLWDAVFEDATRAELIALAKETFPQHAEEFTNETDLSKELPQSLFIELVGILAARQQKIWYENQSLDTALNLLDLYLGLGADTAIAFLRGYESEEPARNAREDLKYLTTGLANQPDANADAVRKYLEQTFTFDRNVIEDGHYIPAPILVRRGEMIEGILTGLTLGEQTGSLRQFRLSGMTRETEVALVTTAAEMIANGNKLPPEMTAQVLTLLDLYTMPPRPVPKDFDFNRWLNPKPEDRWHRLANWSHGDPQVMTRLLDTVVGK